MSRRAVLVLVALLAAFVTAVMGATGSGSSHPKAVAVKIIRYQTEVELRASTPLADGTEAHALDTGNFFKYVTGHGWIQTRIGAVDQGVYNLHIVGDILEHDLAGVTIPGGALGPNGYVEVRAISVLGNASGSTQHITFKLYANNEYAWTAVYAASPSASNSTVTLDGMIANRAGEGLQVMSLEADYVSRATPELWIPAPNAVDTSNDWQMRLTATLSTGDPNFDLFVYKVLVETVYLD